MKTIILLMTAMMLFSPLSYADWHGDNGWRHHEYEHEHHHHRHHYQPLQGRYYQQQPPVVYYQPQPPVRYYQQAPAVIYPRPQYPSNNSLHLSW